jgi:hypothetical protein
MPIDRVMGMLEQVGTGFLNQAIRMISLHRITTFQES